jgi:hypothetical protein
LLPSCDCGSAPRSIDAAIREHILYGYRGNVSNGVLDQSTSAAVVCALHSGVSRNKSHIRALDMCWFFCATSVNIIRLATSAPAHNSAVFLKLDSPDSGNRKSQRIALGTLDNIRSQERKMLGSI